MQYTQIVTVCDVEWQDDDAEVDAEVYTYPLLETGMTEIHFCDQHHEVFETKLNLVEMREWLAKYGRPSAEELSPRKKRKQPAADLADPRLRKTASGTHYQCRWCMKTSSTPQGIGAHEAKAHPEQFFAAGGPKKKK